MLDDNENHIPSSRPLVRVKQESDVEEDGWGTFAATTDIRPMNVVSSNAAQVPLPPTNSTPEMESNTSNNSECVVSNGEVSKDEAAKQAFKVLLDMNLDNLLSHELRQKVRKVQQCCGAASNPCESGSTGPTIMQILHQVDKLYQSSVDNDNMTVGDINRRVAAHFGFSGQIKAQIKKMIKARLTDLVMGKCKVGEGVEGQKDEVADDELAKGEVDERKSKMLNAAAQHDESNVAAASDAGGDQKQTDWKKGHIPMIGSTAYIFQGMFAGLSGKLINLHRGWYQIDNPALGGKHVRFSNIKLVDDGNLDVEAVKDFCAKRSFWLPPLIKPEEVDKANTLTAESRPGGKRSVSENSKPIEETNKRQRKARSREEDNLKDFLQPGGHWFAPIQQRSLVKASEDDLGLNQNLRSMATSSGPVVTSRCWDDEYAHTKGVHGELKPVHYSSLPENVSSIATLVKEELLRRFRPGWDGANDIVSGAYEVQPGSGYYRGHIHNDISASLRDSLPSNVKVKESAGKIGIVFYNAMGGQCDCHFDRDSSALVLVSG